MQCQRACLQVLARRAAPRSAARGVLPGHQLALKGLVATLQVRHLCVSVLCYHVLPLYTPAAGVAAYALAELAALVSSSRTATQTRSRKAAQARTLREA